MIGEINGHSVNTEVPVNGGRIPQRLVVVGFVDSEFPSIGFSVIGDLVVVGFTDSLFIAPILWHEDFAGSIVRFCSDTFLSDFLSVQSEAEGVSQPSEEACQITSGGAGTTFITSVPGFNTRGECDK